MAFSGKKGMDTLIATLVIIAIIILIASYIIPTFFSRATAQAQDAFECKDFLRLGSEATCRSACEPLWESTSFFSAGCKGFTSSLLNSNKITYISTEKASVCCTRLRDPQLYARLYTKKGGIASSKNPEVELVKGYAIYVAAAGEKFSFKIDEVETELGDYDCKLTQTRGAVQQTPVLSVSATATSSTYTEFNLKPNDSLEFKCTTTSGANPKILYSFKIPVKLK